MTMVKNWLKSINYAKRQGARKSIEIMIKMQPIAEILENK